MIDIDRARERLERGSHLRHIDAVAMLIELSAYRAAAPLDLLRRCTCTGCIHRPGGRYGEACQECVRNPINHADFYEEGDP